MSRLSVVLPAYNEELMTAKVCRTLKEILDHEGISYELVLVDDGSSDGTWNQIEQISEQDPNVTAVHFSRNFGKEAAIVAGLAQASGDAVAVMDCDLQHPPETLVKMFRLWEQGYEIVEGIKTNRGKESLLHRKSAGFFTGSCPGQQDLTCRMHRTSSFLTGKLWKVFFPCLRGVCFSELHPPG